MKRVLIVQVISVVLAAAIGYGLAEYRLGGANSWNTIEVGGANSWNTIEDCIEAVTPYTFSTFVQAAVRRGCINEINTYKHAPDQVLRTLERMQIERNYNSLTYDRRPSWSYLSPIAVADKVSLDRGAQSK
jgi:hypothetical protein